MPDKNRTGGSRTGISMTAVCTAAAAVALIAAAVLILVSWQTGRSLSLLKDLTDEQAGLIRNVLKLRTAVSALLLACAAAFLILNWVLVLRPLRKGAEHVRRQEPMPVEGASEVRGLAEAWNGASDRSRKHQESLSFAASHDGLTGVGNRSVFEEIRKDPRIMEGCALLIVDIDDLKAVNDRFGHDAGDRVLQKAAGLLRNSFRSDDCVCRIGGDEFAVVMRGVSSSLKDLVMRKMEAVSERMRETEGEDVPGVTLSVGVAFWDREDPSGDLFKDADTALYRVKENGKNGCAFY